VKLIPSRGFVAESLPSPLPYFPFEIWQQAPRPRNRADGERGAEDMAGDEGSSPRAAARRRARRRQILRAPGTRLAACARLREADDGGSRLDGRQAAGRRRAWLAAATNGKDESGEQFMGPLFV
jgi:hypothetical protein